MVHAQDSLDTRITAVVHAHSPLFMETLTWALESRGYVICAAPRDALTAAALASHFSPRVCILDAAGGTAWLDASRRLRAVAPEVKVVLMGAEPLETIVRAYTNHVVDAVVDPRCAFEQLEATLLRTVRGERSLMEADLAPGHDMDRSAGLTLRERQVLEHLVRGATTNTIAGKLGISQHTVRTHVHGLMRKLDVHGRGRAVSVALARSLVEAR